jgi:hypothetical protein
MSKLWQMKKHPDLEHYNANTKVIHAVPSSAEVSPIGV